MREKKIKMKKMISNFLISLQSILRLRSNVKDFQTLISAKKEFQELASSIKEQTPIPGVYYKHQELILRYMRAYDRLLLLHKTGTGKTCAFDVSFRILQKS